MIQLIKLLLPDFPLLLTDPASTKAGHSVLDLGAARSVGSSLRHISRLINVAKSQLAKVGGARKGTYGKLQMANKHHKTASASLTG